MAVFDVVDGVAKNAASFGFKKYGVVDAGRGVSGDGETGTV